MSQDDDELDASLRAELRGLAPPDPDQGAGSADLRRAVRLGVDAVVKRREARRARWRFLTPLFGTGVAAAAALTFYLKSGGDTALPPIVDERPTPAATDAATLAILETPSTLTPEPLDDEGDDLLEPLEVAPASDDLDDIFALVPSVDDDDELLGDADLSELDDFDPASLARVADALKGT